jgi:starch synthase
MVGAEAFPYAKVGGLGDVLGALPKALAAEGADVTLILPKYRQVSAAKHGLERVPVPEGWSVGLHFVNHGFGLLRGTIPGSTATALFIENDHFFDRWSVYNAEGGRAFPDDAERWLFYQKGCLEVCKVLGLHPDVVHAHDSQGGRLGAYLRTLYPGQPVGDARRLQLDEGGHLLRRRDHHREPDLRPRDPGPEGGGGLDPVLRARAGDVHGVLNGIDLEVWSPQRDPLIPRNYDVGDGAGKRANKKALLERVGLAGADLSWPLVTFVGRLVPQKGCDLLASVLNAVLRQQVLFVGLGSGANQYEDEVRTLQAAYPDRARAVIGYDEELAHWLQAGADILLMPSRYEPCGLNQMYAMTYGTVPVVRATGGLADTVDEAPPDGDWGTGFRFHPYSAHAFGEALYRALAAWQDPPRWDRIVRNGMTRDFSWRRSARSYLELYERARARASP